MMIHRVIMVVLLWNGFVSGMENNLWLQLPKDERQQLRDDLAECRRNVHDMLYAVENNNVSAKILPYCNLSRPVFKYNDSKGKFWRKVTPLIMATFYNHQEMVEFLIEKRVIVNIGDESGNTALHIAARAGRDTLVVTLIKAGANVDKKNGVGDTALQAAQKSWLRRSSNYKSKFENITKMLIMAEEKKPRFLQERLLLRASI